MCKHIGQALWDWTRRTVWDKSCRQCRLLHKFDSHHSFLEISHTVTQSHAEGAGAGDVAAAMDPSGRPVVSFQVLQSRRSLPPSPTPGNVSRDAGELTVGTPSLLPSTISFSALSTVIPHLAALTFSFPIRGAFTTDGFCVCLLHALCSRGQASLCQARSRPGLGAYGR